MISDLQSELRDIVAGYVHVSNASLAAVEDRLWPFLAELDDSSDEELRSTAGAIGNFISEYSRGDRSEESVRKELAAAIRPFETVISRDTAAVSAQSLAAPFRVTKVRLGRERPQSIGVRSEKCPISGRICQFH